MRMFLGAAGVLAFFAVGCGSSGGGEPVSSATTGMSDAAGHSYLNSLTDNLFQEKGQPVDSFELESFPSSASWQLLAYTTIPSSKPDGVINVHTSTSDSGYSSINEEEHRWFFCDGFQRFTSIVDELERLPSPGAGCNLDDLELRRFANGNNFFVEFYCYDQMVAAKSLVFKSVERESLELNMTLDQVSAFNDESVCVSTARYLLEKETEADEFSTEIDIYGEVEGQRYSLEIMLDGKALGAGTHYFDSSAQNPRANDFVMTLWQSSRLNNIPIITGSLQVSELNFVGVFSAEFNATFLAKDDSEVRVFGDIATHR